MRQIVIDAGFGDSGKGFMVDYLSEKNPYAIVERYCGGQQAGHRVVRNGISHVFSNFGSGTLFGNPTYWNANTFDPVGFVNEYKILKSLNKKPIIYVNPNCPITTPIEKILNKQKSIYSNHGSVGAGIYETILREQENKHLYFLDLYNPWVLKEKLKLYYDDLMDDSNWDYFFECVEFITKDNSFLLEFNIDLNDKILESSQGLLLDMDYGFYPHCTPSRVGTQNIKDFDIYKDELFLVTRSYHTRHGNGPFFDDKFPYEVNHPNEMNISTHPFQGEFKIAPLNLDLLKYAVLVDDGIRNSNNKNLVITCMNHHKNMNKIPLIENDELKYFEQDKFIEYIYNELNCISGFTNFYISYGEEAKDLLDYY